jgi:hypothetical protein
VEVVAAGSGLGEPPECVDPLLMDRAFIELIHPRSRRLLEWARCC